ncbi:MAG: peptidylprolyl isomerase [Acidimicrobiales bacterium]
MRKNLLLIVLLAAAVLAASCGVSREPTASSSGTAATVEFGDGSSQDLPRGDLNELVSSTSANDEFVALVYNGTVPAGFEAIVLSQSIIGEVLTNELDAVGVEPSEADRDEARTLLLGDLENIAASSPTPGTDVEQLYDDVPYLAFIADLQAKQLALSSALAADAPADSGSPCVRHILLEDQAAAEEVLSELDGGADFATLAMERSTGPSAPAGGDLGCAPATNYVPEFGDAVLAAEVGVYVGPVETQFGFHVILVEGYEVNGEQLAQAALNSGMAEINVTVDEEIGVWDADQGTVVAAQPTP